LLREVSEMVTPVKVTEVERLPNDTQTPTGAQDAHRRQVERVKASLVSCPGGRRSSERRPNGTP
jgi:hypothetical protein